MEIQTPLEVNVHILYLLQEKSIVARGQTDSVFININIYWV